MENGVDRRAMCAHDDGCDDDAVSDAASVYVSFANPRWTAEIRRPSGNEARRLLHAQQCLMYPRRVGVRLVGGHLAQNWISAMMAEMMV